MNGRQAWMAVALLAGFIASRGVAQPHPSSAPALYLIGDSTVRNGSGRGADGLWGWGSVLGEHFDAAKIRIENHAIGGRSSRTFLTEGRWEAVLKEIKPGDFVMMQFGHNDGGGLTGNRGRGSLKGNGEETQTITNNAGNVETVHTYGWYLRRYVADAKTKGATPIVLSQIPRNLWKDGKVGRESNGYGRFAKEAAEQGGAAFLDLNEIVAARYEQFGEARVRREFFKTNDHTHTTLAGAKLNAACVVEGIRQLKDPVLAGALLPPRLRFDFSGGKVDPDWTTVSTAQLYSPSTGFGFESIARPDAGAGGVTGERPFLFSVDVPEGNYRVTATLGGNDHASTNTVKAELRRLMMENLNVGKGEAVTREFCVSVRTPKISGGDFVRLKPREKTNEMVNWDDRLTLEFSGTRPSLRTLEIALVTVPTVFLLGDSTVCDQPLEPWNSWGQMLPRFFKPEIAVANHAQSGESIKSSLGAWRFEKVFSLMKPGDWLFLQFGHNDMKDRATNALAAYRENLRKIVARAREQGGTPVLVTSMERKSGVERDTLEGYPDAVRAVAREEGVALIDLHAMSKVLYRALGADLDKAFQDGTHHNDYGSYELARCVVEGIRKNVPALAKSLAEDVPKFDPNQPDPPEKFHMPESPGMLGPKPDGN